MLSMPKCVIEAMVHIAQGLPRQQCVSAAAAGGSLYVCLASLTMCVYVCAVKQANCLPNPEKERESP